MKKNILIFILSAIATTILAYSCNTANSDKAVNGFIKDSLLPEVLIERGKYLVTIAGCNDCHSPKIFGTGLPRLDTANLLSGYPSNRTLPEFPVTEIQKGMIILLGDGTAAMGTWGTTFAANITPDATGIGNWTEAQFKNALTHGKFKGLDGARMLMPPMPWQDYINMKDEDVKAIYYYLKFIKPVHNVVPAFKPLAQ